MSHKRGASRPQAISKRSLDNLRQNFSGANSVRDWTVLSGVNTPDGRCSVAELLKEWQDSLTFAGIDFDVDLSCYLSKNRINKQIKALRATFYSIFVPEEPIKDNGYDVAITRKAQMSLGLLGNNCLGRVTGSDEDTYFVAVHKDGIFLGLGWDRVTEKRSHTEVRNRLNAEATASEEMMAVALKWEEKAYYVQGPTYDETYVMSTFYNFEIFLKKLYAASLYGEDVYEYYDDDVYYMPATKLSWQKFVFRDLSSWQHWDHLPRFEELRIALEGTEKKLASQGIQGEYRWTVEAASFFGLLGQQSLVLSVRSCNADYAEELFKAHKLLHAFKVL
jgi:hypothetical protein